MNDHKPLQRRFCCGRLLRLCATSHWEHRVAFAVDNGSAGEKLCLNLPTLPSDRFDVSIEGSAQPGEVVVATSQPRSLV